MKKSLVLVSSIFAGAAGIVAGATITGILKGKQVSQKTEKVNKFKGYYTMLNQWLLLKQEGRSLEEYFVVNGYKTIAIYGMGEMGNRLYDELKNTSIEVKCGIDKNALSTYSELEVIDLDDEIPEVDAVVITATFAFDEIEEELSEKISCPIVSLDDAVYEI